MEDSLTVFHGKIAEPAQPGHYFHSELNLCKDAKCLHNSFPIILTRTKLNEDPEADIARRQPDQIIQTGGDVNFISRMYQRYIIPKLWPRSLRPPYYENHTTFSSDPPIKYKPGILIIITGHCFGDSQGEFVVNFEHAHSNASLFHFNPRFHDSVVIRNTSIDGVGLMWGKEEREGGFPFDFNNTFRIGFVFREKYVLIAVNGLFFCSYTYREPDNKNILSHIVGPICYGRNGAGIHITGIDHVQLKCPECNNFEKYTKLESEIG